MEDAARRSGFDHGVRRPLFGRLAAFSLRHRRAILVGAGLFTVVAGILGSGATSHLSEGGSDAPSEQSVRAAQILGHEFHAGDSNFFVVVTARRGNVDSPATAAAGAALTRRLRHAHDVVNVQSYWSLGDVGALESKGHTQALIVGRILGDQNQVVDREPAIGALFERAPAAVEVQVGGFADSYREIDVLVERGLIASELIAIPITFVVLLIVYGSVVAALLPLGVGAMAVTGTLLTLRILAAFTTVSVFAENMTTALGLGLAIDYSLFMVTRYREELAAGHRTDEAVCRTVASAGRTVAGSSLTVAAALAAMMVFPIIYLQSFAYVGVAVALLAGLSAVLVLPALLGVLGPRVNAATVWRRSITPRDVGLWSHTARRVMRHPIVVIVAVTSILLLLATPFLGLKFGSLDYRILPPTDSVRLVNDHVVDAFGVGETQQLEVVIPKLAQAPGSPARTRVIADYADRLSRLPGVEYVAAFTGVSYRGVILPAPAGYLAQFNSSQGTWLSVIPKSNALSSSGRQLVEAVRATPSPGPALVGGSPAEFVDSTAIISHDLPLVLLLVGAVSFIVLFCMFKSVLIACKALVLSALSLSAMLGAMVWVFQEGHLSGLLGFTATGNLSATTPILMFCVAFGLSMDYEVFLISRIKEQHDAGLDDVEAVALGLQRTGRIVTAAAVLISAVFLGQLVSGIASVKLFGLGVSLAVLMDALAIRGLLVPAFMKLAGRANWWAPSWTIRRSGPASVSAPARPPRSRDEVPERVGALV
jgi:putative drug exporter of the RND superfamily